ncbi:alanine--tRNA ligase [candidate division WOR-3 bacterium]|uniref:Alanine--tRNA ligase n=1 Tax=candidate division WOR-3 bacterium TaxID=2052148 RepID=A0A660SLI0_UNCW3|nr:MAG: alanine--tRNA ligase [candidate division WOR-3 bacterium]
MRSNELRRIFLDYFARLDHKIVPGSSLIPKDDPTLLFTSAGMVQFKPYWSGLTEPPFRRAVSVQRCLRLSDIEKVGRTTRHLSFFEMLGNFSFGDYFKKEAIEWAWRFLVEVLKIDPDRLSVSVHKDDEEAYQIWKGIGLEPVRLGDEDNFWGPAGKTGACGPSSEIFYDLGEELGCGKDSCGPGCDCDRFPEIWNLVFPQFDQKENGERLPLKNRGIDTGMGLERLAMVTSGQKSLFTTDLFRPIIEELEGMFGSSYQGNEVAFNIIADHTRALVFAITDGIIPSNESRGYVLRRLLRRALVYANKLGYYQPFIHRLSMTVIDLMKEIYPQLDVKRELIEFILKAEEERFLKTIAIGLEVFESRAKKRMSGEEAFLLYDSYGFPIELIQELAQERKIEVDVKGFNDLLTRRRQESRRTMVFTTIDLNFVKEVDRVEFRGYETDRLEAEVVGFARRDKEIYLVINPTPFYPESGGQVGDRGVIEGKDFRVDIDDTFYYQGLIVSKGKLTGDFQPGMVRARVDQKRRQEIRRAHTATHLLHRALKNVIGEWVRQEGSLVEPGRLRFDFIQFHPISEEDLARIESLVYEKILADIEVEKFETDFQTALRMGAVALFGEKYGDRVRVVKIGDFSIELCGGLHLDRTGEIGIFTIQKESGVAAGIRRIDALVGFRARDEIIKQMKLIGELKSILGENLLNRARQLDEELHRLTSQIKEMKKRLVAYEAEQAKFEEINGLKYYRLISDLDDEGMRLIADQLRRREMTLGLILQKDGRIVTFVNPELTDRITAVEMMKVINRRIGGGGGGRGDLAQGGGIDVQRIDEAEKALKDYIKEKFRD